MDTAELNVGSMSAMHTGSTAKTEVSVVPEFGSFYLSACSVMLIHVVMVNTDSSSGMHRYCMSNNTKNCSCPCYVNRIAEASQLSLHRT